MRNVSINTFKILPVLSPHPVLGPGVSVAIWIAHWHDVPVKVLGQQWIFPVVDNQLIDEV